MLGLCRLERDGLHTGCDGKRVVIYANSAAPVFGILAIAFFGVLHEHGPSIES